MNKYMRIWFSVTVNEVLQAPGCVLLTGFVCQVRLSGKSSTPVNNCPGVGSISDPTNQAVDARDISDLKVCILFRIELDVEAIQSWVLLREHALAEKCEYESCSFVQVKVLIPFGKCD